MKNLVLYVSFLCAVPLFSQEVMNQTVTTQGGNTILLGKTNKKAFKKEPFKKWFSKNYDNYLQNNNIINLLKNDLKDYTIKVFYGTWCGDSRKELPRFYKVIDQANYNKNKIEFIAVHNIKEQYKQAPNREEKGLNIHRVPAFIFYKNGKEVNRIVEHPKETFERDILKIISNKKYIPNYKGVSYLEKLFKEKPLESIKQQKDYLIYYLAEVTNGTKELNTYGNVKLTANDLEKAQYIFELNTKVHPYSITAFETLGDFYFEQKEYKKALKNYYKSLSLYPKNEEVKNQITKIEALIAKK